ncbi:hypothetical protein [Sulfuracidifex tepidarius]|uniref:Uncharacterized protein n=1 Tax=Sulfuracidifex tepidarius TaxID=1294262 RepID=A0A510DVR1_9CREN|nr:hypothetical protein [Sulfuracidifex tepidarius]BBG24285.1 hypothetical protein IC006_1594 [Sulfuracidifex tepidarius]BBG27042.1 hypothetical protein IC007_1571 [Sulfuracidifex tepidarius]
MKSIVNPLTLRLPKKIQLYDGETVSLNDNDIKNERNFCLKVPPTYVNSVASSLIKIGFKKPSLAFKMGEKYSLSKVVLFPWELHIRIYDNGCIYSHIEIYRKYIQHLLGYTFPYLEGTFSLISNIHEAELTYKNIKLKKILEYKTFSLKSPRLLLPWKPLFMLSAVIAGVSLGKHIQRKFSGWT